MVALGWVGGDIKKKAMGQNPAAQSFDRNALKFNFLVVD